MLGNTKEPGVTSSVNSAPFVSGSADSPGTPLIVGEADLDSGSANTEEVYSISNGSQAQNLFGKDSRLTYNIFGASNQGASPILAVAPEEETVSQDLSGLTDTTSQLDNPAKESVEDMTVTVDSEDKTVEFYLEDLEEKTVESGKVYFNPATDRFKLDETPSSSGTFEYTHVKYQSALNAVEEYGGDFDFLTALKERSGVTSSVLGTVTTRASEYSFALAVAGVEPPVDASEFSNSYDDSRLQLVAPSRMDNMESLLGAFVGLRAAIGISSTPINQRLVLRDRPYRALNETERGDLIDKFVTPLQRIGQSAAVVDDLTTVSDENSEEQAYKYGFSRLVVDFLIGTVHELEQPFIGKFNSPGVIGQLEDLLNKSARPLTQSNAIYSYNAEVELVTPTTAKVRFYADVAEPIRFIDNDFVIGNDLTLQN